MCKKVVITGISGFLGSHIASVFLKSNWQVIGLKRSSSDLWRLENEIKNIIWKDIDNETWINQIIELDPDLIIHSAWEGVGANDRINYQDQLANISLLFKVLEICKKTNSRFIGLGSQAEYGTYNVKVNEEYKTEPNTAYGVVKLMSYNLVRGFCNENKIEWFWLRLFPLFGEQESSNWLIPSVIKKIINCEEIDLTPCLQKYSYLFVNDFAQIVLNFSEIKSSETIFGVYNISGGEPISLRDLMEKIRDLMNQPAKLNFGALKYRTYQSMLMQGDMSKYEAKISKVNYTAFEEALSKTIKYYINKFK